MAVRVHSHQPGLKTSEGQDMSKCLKTEYQTSRSNDPPVAASHTQSIRTLLPALPGTDLYVDVVLAVLYHTDVGLVDGLLVVFNASRPVSSRADHLESRRETPSALSLQDSTMAPELSQGQGSSLAQPGCH